MAKSPAVIEQRPAYLAAYQARIAAVNEEFHVDAGKAIGLISIKNGVWSARISGESFPFLDGEYPARYIDMAFVRANPNTSKVYYIDPFNEDTPAPPDCASADGITPDAGVPNRQSPTCATCQWNAWRSDPSGSGKGKACKDNKRAAMLPEGDFENEDYNGPVLLRIPPASLSNFAVYQKEQTAAGRSLIEIMTRMSFDPKASGQVIQFQFVRWLREDEVVRILEWRDDEHVERMLSIDENKAKAVEDGETVDEHDRPAPQGLSVVPPRPPQRAAAAETVAAAKAAPPKPAGSRPAAKPAITPAPAEQTREQRVAEMRAKVAAMKAAKAPPPPEPTEEELAEAALAAEEAALAAELTRMEAAPSAKPNGRGRRLAVVAPKPPAEDDNETDTVSDDDTLDALDRLAADL
jgi:hypothetical protein